MGNIPNMQMYNKEIYKHGVYFRKSYIKNVSIGAFKNVFQLFRKFWVYLFERN